MPHSVGGNMTQMVQSKWSPGQSVVAAHNFEAKSNDDLPFIRGEILSIVKCTKDPNWYKACNAMGREGMIPANYMEPNPVQQNSGLGFNRQHSGSMHPHFTAQFHRDQPAQSQAQPPVRPQQPAEIQQQSMPWFHGRIPREEAEHLLYSHEDGVFLVRESKHYPGDYTLCVSYGKKVENYHIKCVQKKLTIDDEVLFCDLMMLVQHYKGDADGLCTKLLRALPKKGAFDVSVDIRDFQKSGWAIRLDELKIGDIIGNGDFGSVFKGVYRKNIVAVKELKETTSAKSVQSILKEASVMTSLRHPNLVQLIGVVISDNILLVTEFMDKGNLVDYLRSRGRTVITKKQQIEFASDTCAAMAYLESKNLVHRDLAARNILVNDDNVAKVSDFGLALHEDVKQDGGKFPIKWTSPEALRESKFTSKSDMWSFGILLWEIYSFGRVPYPRIPLADVVMHVEKGYRMEAPEGCPKEIYEIMIRAWNILPEKRPTFHLVCQDLNDLKAITV